MKIDLKSPSRGMSGQFKAWFLFLLKALAAVLRWPWQMLQWLADRLLGLTEHAALHNIRVLHYLCLLMLVIFWAWASFFKIDQVIHALGQVVASTHSQVLQATDGGVLARLDVKEGDEVQAGQVIAVLDKERQLASFKESQGRMMALKMTITRLNAELSNAALTYDHAIRQDYPMLYETQMNLYKQRRKLIEDQLKLLQDNIALAQQELEMNQPLERSGDISQVELLRLRRAVNEAKNQLEFARNKYVQEASAELNKAQEDLNAQEQVLADRAVVLEHTDIVAPTKGLVKSVRITTLGGVLRQGDEILQILPTDSDLIIEAKVKPSDMANIRIGVPAKVKLDAYDYAIFGTLNGVVSYVSPDALSEDTRNGVMNYYRVKVVISGRDLKDQQRKLDIEVRPGMTATVDIQTGSRSVMSYITKPLIKTVSEAFGER